MVSEELKILSDFNFTQEGESNRLYRSIKRILPKYEPVWDLLCGTKNAFKQAGVFTDIYNEISMLTGKRKADAEAKLYGTSQKYIGIVNQVDEYKNFDIAKKQLKRSFHRQSYLAYLWYRTVNVIVTNDEGKVLVLKRSKSKQFYPG